MANPVDDSAPAQKQYHAGDLLSLSDVEALVGERNATMLLATHRSRPSMRMEADLDEGLTVEFFNEQIRVISAPTLGDTKERTVVGSFLLSKEGWRDNDPFDENYRQDPFGDEVSRERAIQAIAERARRAGLNASEQLKSLARIAGVSEYEYLAAHMLEKENSAANASNGDISRLARAAGLSDEAFIAAFIAHGSAIK